MLSKTMLNALNTQLNIEMHSSYLYLGMTAYFKGINLDGCASWMAKQSKEEWDHAMKIWNFIHDRRSQITLNDIKKPPVAYKSVLEVFQAGLKAEESNTARFDELTALARKEKDLATEIFLQWFVTEQIEEESQFDMVIQKMKLAGESPAGLLMLDKELGARAS